MSSKSDRSRGSGFYSGGQNSRGSGQRKPAGAFVDNTWLCDCKPRIPANHFKVKKEGPNKGRWFYSCQKQDGERCGFFLWQDDATPRERAAVLANSRNEPQVKTPSRTGPQQRVSPPQKVSPSPRKVAPSPQKTSPRPNQSMPPNAGKRKLQAEVDGEDEDEFGWPTKNEVEQEIVTTLESSMPPPVTPRKAIKTSSMATPNSKGLLTPVSNRKINLGLTPQADTPTPSRFASTPSSETEANESLVPEVMHFLEERNVRLDGDDTDALKLLLRRHIARSDGVIRGREISRLALRGKDARINELQARIGTMEVELETLNAVIQNLKWQKDTGQF